MNNNKNTELAFKCGTTKGGCGKRFTATQYQTANFPEREWYPYVHSAVCPACGLDAGQANWQLGQWKAVYDHGRPGPTTAEGLKAIADATKNRDPSSFAVSRFNAITHGATAEVAKFFPARPGKYPVCDGCEYLLDGCGTEMRHCAKRTELFVQFALAQEQGDGRLLGRLMASTQAGLLAITGDMIRAIAARGVELERPMFVRGDKGGIDLATYRDEFGNQQTIMEVSANPLLKPLIDLMSKNGMTLADLNLTPAAAEEQKRFDGYLDDKEADRQSVADAMAQQQANMDKLLAVMNRGSKLIPAGRVIDVEPETD
ncbi:hypothetical protein [Thiolinea disciformis]|uniref:hypothetical protein n=1 Tax=Thiolinea disciformis TaxID=125614 RepID=UPI000373BDF1|nr:hypothetical protein [Thiolinea disciformis]